MKQCLRTKFLKVNHLITSNKPPTKLHNTNKYEFVIRNLILNIEPTIIIGQPNHQGQRTVLPSVFLVVTTIYQVTSIIVNYLPMIMPEDMQVPIVLATTHTTITSMMQSLIAQVWRLTLELFQKHLQLASVVAAIAAVLVWI